MQILPTIVLVHGAWHQVANYQSFIDALSSVGFSVDAPRLPSCTNSYTTPPSISTPEDVAVVNAAVKEHVEAGEDVLLLMHSYGGLVGTDALSPELLRTARAAEQKPGGVLHLLYLAAYLLEPGTSVIDISKASGLFPTWPQFVTDYDDGSTFPVDPSLLFFSGIGEPAVVEKALSTLVRSPLSAFNTPAQRDAWNKLPVTYVHTLLDYAAPYAYQTIMIDRAQKAGADIQTKTYNTSHSVFITEQQEMVDLAVEVTKDSRNPA